MTDNSPSSAASWRDEAMNAALEGFGYTENLDALLQAIRRAQPRLHTHIIWPDHERVLDFLAEQNAVQSLLSASSLSTSSDQELPYFAWYRLLWEGHEIEIVLGPKRDGDTVCVGSEENVLRQFANALLEFEKLPRGRCLVFSTRWRNAPEMDAEIGKVTWDDIVLPPEMHQQLRQSIEGFFEQKAALAEFGFAWRRGVLLVGPPGTGKTMVCKAAAAALPDLPFLYVRDLHSSRRQPDPIKAVFRRARRLAPCILAIEDIDGFINSENRSIFLNEMDGFANNEGLLIIASSNHPGKIDEALLKRPSRFDRVFHLGLPAKEERAAFCHHVLSRAPLSNHLASDLEVEDLCEKVALRSDGFTPAYLKEAVISAALQSAQDGAKVLDESFAAHVLAQVEQLRDHLKRLKNPDALGEMRALDDVIGFRR